MAASDSSCSICYSAKGFKLTEETEKNFFTQVRSYWGDHSFPDLEDESAQWAVNVAVPSASFKHHSLIFRNLKTGEHFRVELIVYRNQVYPKTSYFNPKSKDLPPLEYKNFGSCSGSARSLFRFCLQKLQSLGDYQGAFRNCQDYCQAVVKDLTDGKHITDCEKAIGWTVLGLLGAVAAGAAYYMLKPNDKNDKK